MGGTTASIAERTDVNGRTKSARAEAVRAEGAPEFVAESVEEIARLEGRDRIAMGWSDRLADRLAGFSGSMAFIGVHALVFGGWIVGNARIGGLGAFDPYPYQLLTMLVSLEAIFLATFVLISQNRQALHADRRAKVALQVNVISEQELTKVMDMLRELRQQMGVHRHDPELEEMTRRTYIADIADAVDEAERKLEPEVAKGPDSAVDTEA